MTLFTIFSHVLSILNIITWIGVAIPQMITNYKNKSSDAISFLLVYCWLLGGALSLVSAILANAAITIIYTGFPHLILDILMVIQLIYYRIKNRVWFPSSDLIYIIISLLFVIGITTFSTRSIIISAFSWSATGIFIIARLPQIILNYRRKSTFGLSKVSFICVMITNLLFLGSILFLTGNYPSKELNFIKSNSAWILGSTVSFIFDLVILLQFNIYKNNNSFGYSEII